jgi:dolichol-phosphate mannosyltransferase
MKTISIVISIYYGEEFIASTMKRLNNLKFDGYNVEFIFVDDGSGDDSLKVLLEEKKKYDNVKVIKLSKNFGAMSAMQVGLNHASGDCIGYISSDLQDPPELFIDMVKEWEEGKKVVLAVRQDREEPLSQKLFANTYYYLLEKLAIPDYPKGGFDFILIDKQVKDEIVKMNEKNTNLMSLIFWSGYDRATIPYVRQQRDVGVSRWTMAKKIKLFIDSFVSFSYVPIRFMSFIGFITSFLSFFYTIFIIFSYLSGSIEVEGWTTIVSLITFLLGLIMMMLGVIGEYLWRILDETRKRPHYLIDEIYE